MERDLSARDAVESVDLLIEFDVPKPPTALYMRPSEPIWTRRLQPLRNRPGHEARIKRGLTKLQADQVVRSAKRGLEKADDTEHWEFSTRECVEDNSQGVWAVFLGHYTEAEILRIRKERYERRGKNKQGRLRNSLAKAEKLGRQSASHSLRPPVMLPD